MHNFWMYVPWYDHCNPLVIKDCYLFCHVVHSVYCKLHRCSRHHRLWGITQNYLLSRCLPPLQHRTVCVRDVSCRLRTDQFAKEASEMLEVNITRISVATKKIKKDMLGADSWWTQSFRWMIFCGVWHPSLLLVLSMLPQISNGFMSVSWFIQSLELWVVGASILNVLSLPSFSVYRSGSLQKSVQPTLWFCLPQVIKSYVLSAFTAWHSDLVLAKPDELVMWLYHPNPNSFKLPVTSFPFFWK